MEGPDEWEERYRPRFGNRWGTVQRILAHLEGMGIFQMDPSPVQIDFGERLD